MIIPDNRVFIQGKSFALISFCRFPKKGIRSSLSPRRQNSMTLRIFAYYISNIGAQTVIGLSFGISNGGIDESFPSEIIAFEITETVSIDRFRDRNRVNDNVYMN